MAGFLFSEGHQNWIRGKVSVHTEVLIMILAVYGFAFSLLVFAGLKFGKPKVSDYLILCATTLTIATSVYVVAIVDFMGVYRTDALAFSHYAALLFLKGQNPYAADLQNALSMFAVNPEFITVTVGGDMITSLNYPALHFLLLVPAVAVGVRDVRIVLFIFELATVMVVFRAAPEGFKGIALIPFLAGTDLAIGFTAGCITDFLWVLPCAIATLYLENPKISGLAYGVACAVKQIPWVAFPFLVIWYWKMAPENRRSNSLEVFLSWVTMSFMIPNLPFILWDWRSWLSGILTPITGGLILLSRGISAVSQLEAIPLPPMFYLICVAAALLVLIFNYFCHFDVMKHTLWILPGIVLWFSYRALQNYFIYWIPLLEISVIRMLSRKTSSEDV